MSQKIVDKEEEVQEENDELIDLCDEPSKR